MKEKLRDSIMWVLLVFIVAMFIEGAGSKIPEVHAQIVRPVVLSAATQTPVGVSAVQLPNTGTVLGVMLKAISPGQIVYIGTTSAVSTTTGFPLSDGDSIILEVSNANQVWAVATASGQRVAVFPYRRQ